MREVARREVDYLLSHNVIAPSSSSWSFPMVLVKKKDGGLRFCIDYRALNAITKPFAYPLHKQDELIDHLGEAKYFTILDARSGYWQIEIDQKDREKTAFIGPEGGLYEFTRLPMGLSNAPGTYQGLMDLILAGVSWRFCLVYLDDIIIFSKTQEEHLKHIEEVLERMKKAGLTLKFSKCQFGQLEVLYLGHIISAKGIRPNPEKIQVVKDFRAPHTVKEVRAFLGLTGHYRRFIKSYSTKARPLINLTKLESSFEWTPDCDTSFSLLKDALTSDPILRLPNYSLPFYIECDACNEGIGGVLSQRDEHRREYVIAYVS